MRLFAVKVLRLDRRRARRHVPLVLPHQAAPRRPRRQDHPVRHRRAEGRAAPGPRAQRPVLRPVLALARAASSPATSATTTCRTPTPVSDVARLGAAGLARADALRAGARRSLIAIPLGVLTAYKAGTRFDGDLQHRGVRPARAPELRARAAARDLRRGASGSCLPTQSNIAPFPLNPIDNWRYMLMPTIALAVGPDRDLHAAAALGHDRDAAGGLHHHREGQGHPHPPGAASATRCARRASPCSPSPASTSVRSSAARSSSSGSSGSRASAASSPRRSSASSTWRCRPTWRSSRSSTSCSTSSSTSSTPSSTPGSGMPEQPRSPAESHPPRRGDGRAPARRADDPDRGGRGRPRGRAGAQAQGPRHRGVARDHLARAAHRLRGRSRRSCRSPTRSTDVDPGRRVPARARASTTPSASTPPGATCSPG